MVVLPHLALRLAWLFFALARLEARSAVTHAWPVLYFLLCEHVRRVRIKFFIAALAVWQRKSETPSYSACLAAAFLPHAASHSATNSALGRLFLYFLRNLGNVLAISVSQLCACV